MPIIELSNGDYIELRHLLYDGKIDYGHKIWYKLSKPILDGIVVPREILMEIVDETPYTNDDCFYCGHSYIVNPGHREGCLWVAIRRILEAHAD